MRKLAYIFGIALFLFGCAGQFPQIPQISPTEKFLPIDYSQSEKNSREVWFEFRDRWASSRSKCLFLHNKYRRVVKGKYTILRSGRILFNIDAPSHEKYEFLNLTIDEPSSSLIAYSGTNGLNFDQKLSFEFDQIAGRDKNIGVRIKFSSFESSNG